MIEFQELILAISLEFSALTKPGIAAVTILRSPLGARPLICLSGTLVDVYGNIPFIHTAIVRNVG